MLIKPMPTWTISDTIMISISIGFGLMMIISGIVESVSMILVGSGVGLVLATFLVSILYNRNMKKLNTIFSYNKGKQI
jgi:hypothetical protein